MVKTRKEDFIPHLLKVLEHDLINKLPDKPQLQVKLLSRSHSIISETITHILGNIGITLEEYIEKRVNG